MNDQTKIAGLIRLADLLETMAAGYREAIYFTETGDTEQPAADCELSEEAAVIIASECRRWFEAVPHAIALALSYDAENSRKGAREIAGQIGIDLWLSRNGHGTGFFDRADLYGHDATNAMEGACGWRTAFPEQYLYQGDDGPLYLEGGLPPATQSTSAGA